MTVMGVQTVLNMQHKNGKKCQLINVSLQNTNINGGTVSHFKCVAEREFMSSLYVDKYQF